MSEQIAVNGKIYQKTLGLSKKKRGSISKKLCNKQSAVNNKTTTLQQQKTVERGPVSSKQERINCQNKVLLTMRYIGKERQKSWKRAYKKLNQLL